MIQDFFKKLVKYMNTKDKDNTDAFKYLDTVIDFDTAELIYNVWCQKNMLEEAYAKECDYNRLLRQENNNLNDELEYVYSKEDNEPDIIIEYDNKELPS